MGFGPGFDTGFAIMSTIVPLFFIVVLGFIVFAIVRGISQWSHNNKQPVLSVTATIRTKRSDTSHSTNTMNDNMGTSSTTWYYATFEVESGDRMEFSIPGREFGLLAEGDRGKLTFQGTRYLGFERQ